LLVVSLIEIFVPAAAVAGADRAEMTRSGPIMIGRERVLLVSTASATTPPSSALATMK